MQPRLEAVESIYFVPRSQVDLGVGVLLSPHDMFRLDLINTRSSCALITCEPTMQRMLDALRDGELAPHTSTPLVSGEVEALLRQLSQPTRVLQFPVRP